MYLTVIEEIKSQLKIEQSQKIDLIKRLVTVKNTEKMCMEKYLSKEAVSDNIFRGMSESMKKWVWDEQYYNSIMILQCFLWYWMELNGWWSKFFSGQRHQQSCSSLGPEILIAWWCVVHSWLDGKHYSEHVGLSFSHSGSDWIHVSWASVEILTFLRLLLAFDKGWLELDDWHLVVKLHWFRLSDAIFVAVPLSALQKEAADVCTFFGWPHYALIELLKAELPYKLINGDVGLSWGLLLKSSGETCREGESGNPEHVWLSLCNPISKLIYSLVEIKHPEWKWLQWIVSEFPLLWHLIFEKWKHNLLQLLADQH